MDIPVCIPQTHHGESTRLGAHGEDDKGKEKEEEDEIEKDEEDPNSLTRAPIIITIITSLVKDDGINVGEQDGELACRLDGGADKAAVRLDADVCGTAESQRARM